MSPLKMILLLAAAAMVAAGILLLKASDQRARKIIEERARVNGCLRNAPPAVAALLSGALGRGLPPRDHASGTA
jgi:hypothetical protein